MVLIWHGRGIIVLFVFIAAAVASMAVTIFWIGPAFDIAGDDRVVNLGIAMSTLLSAIATWPLGRLVMKPVPARQPDTLCFIDIRYWTFIFAGLTAIMLAVAAVPLS
jgi:hypothetical protein